MSALSLTLVDESASGEVFQKTVLKLVSERVKARELIEQRVRQEVGRFNQERAKKKFNGLVRPLQAEEQLNGFKLKRRRTIDADKQVEVALQAFESNGYFLLVDDRQVESLDEDLILSESSTVAFIKLIPVVGG